MAKSTGNSGSSPSTGGPDLFARLKGLTTGTSGIFAEWSDERLAGMLDLVIDSGSAVIIGRTSDRGAVCLTFLVGTDKFKAYASSCEDLDGIAEAVHDALAE